MKTFYLQEHSSFCNCHKDNRDKYLNYQDNHDNFWHSLKVANYYLCEKNPVRMLFYHNNDFILLVFNSCITTDKYEFLCDILKSSLKSKNKLFVKISKSNVYDKILLAKNNEELNLKNLFTEINFIYRDSAQKKYCIESVIPFENVELDSDLIRENYKKAKKELLDSYYNKDYLLHELEQLFYANCPPNIKENQIIKTTNELIKIINTYGNNKKSK